MVDYTFGLGRDANGRVKLYRRVEDSYQVFLAGDFEGIAFEEHFVENDTKGPNISALIVLVS